MMFAGCGSSDDKTTGGTDAAKEETTGTETDAAKKDTSGKKYVIATDTVFAPFEFTNAEGDFVGIDVDILDAIAKDQGFEYELQSLGFDAALVAVQSGQADGVIAGMSITDERKETFDFSEAYYDADV
ncbi:MAG: transporter substrate-binding domain-containing protein, partial [Lachnospiraceae bacterium]|nr:transporter substrate-binding domain-containing protein [Lachnospiraceae bacterium]